MAPRQALATGVCESVSGVDECSPWAGARGNRGSHVEGETTETAQIGTTAKEGRCTMVKNTATTLLMLLLTLVAACAPAAPTPTRIPEPTPTAVWILATEPEHLAGIWDDGAAYVRYAADGTETIAASIELLDSDYVMTGKFWFEDGLFYEEPPVCISLFVCEFYLRIEEGRAVRARYTIIEEPDPPCPGYRKGTQRHLVRVD
jgi:hypothetical protein